MLDRILEETLVLSKDQPLILFGADCKGEILYDFLSEAGYSVLFFVDNASGKQNTKFCGLDVFSPLVLLDKPDFQVIITSAHINAIREQLQDLGVKNFITPKFIDFAPFGNRKPLLREISENQDKIDLVLSYLEDELSKKTYKGIIEFCKTLDVDIINDISDSRFPQYFDDEIIKLGENEVFVDGGCHNFHTSLQFINKVNGKYKKIIAFEPDNINFSEIIANSKTYHNVEIINRGIYSKNTTLKFKQNGSYDSMFTDSGNLETAVVSLDNIITEPTYIKFDIEGCELDGLIGSEKIIKEYKPKLAICIYHKISDFWTVPLLIKKFNDKYKLYIRHYRANQALETVCYAVPE